MKGWVRKSFIWVLAVICLLGIGLTVRQMIHNRTAAQANSQAQSIVGAIQPTVTTTAPTANPETAPPSTEAFPVETTPPTLPPDENIAFLKQLDIPALQKINPEVIGWFYLPDTVISYPLLHAQSNDTYLHTAWDGTPNVAGSIFLETQCAADLTGFNTIIYGHNMRNGSMFAALKDYKKYDFLREHPYIYIVTNDTVYRYAVFSAYEAGIKSATYWLDVKTDAQKQTAIEHYLDSSVWNADLIPSTEDSVLTLSTCTGTGTYETRWVVQAVLLGQWYK